MPAARWKAGAARGQAAAGDRGVAPLAAGLLEDRDHQVGVLGGAQRGQHPARPAAGDGDVDLQDVEVDGHANAAGTP
jgi:hypothetical protein